MKTLKILSFILFLNLISHLSKAQGINFGFGSGTEIARLEIGYSISEDLHFGAQISPGISSFDLPGFYGGFFRKTFKEDDFGGGFWNASYRGYIGASLGLIRSKGGYDLLTGEKNLPKSTLGIAGTGGIEILYGKKGRFGSFFELNIGQVPNYMTTLGNKTTNLLSPEEEQKEVKLASLWGFNAGFRVYFGKK